MKIYSSTEARKNFATILDKVVDDCEEALIHRSGGKSVILIALDSWNALQASTTQVNSK